MVFEAIAFLLGSHTIRMDETTLLTEGTISEEADETA